MSLEGIKDGDTFLAVRLRLYRNRGAERAISEMQVVSVGTRWIDAVKVSRSGRESLQFLHDGSCPEFPWIRGFKDEASVNSWVKRKSAEKMVIQAIKRDWRTFEQVIESISEEDLLGLVRILVKEPFVAVD